METIIALLPKCPLNCLVTALFNSTCASDPQASCLCTNEPFNNAATACIMSACSVKDSLTAKNLTLSLCGQAPVSHPLAEPTFPISLTFLSLAGISVLLRLYSRYHMRTALWWDDFCDVIALFLCTAFVGTNMHMIRITHGYDMWFVEFDVITEFLVETYICFIFYLLGRSAIRFSIILFYMRIFRVRLAKNLLLTSLVVNILFCFSAITAIVFQCTPVNYFWNQWDGEHEGQCVSTKDVVWACAAIAFIFDLWLVILPMPFIARLNLSWQKKAQTSIMFIIGLAVIVASVFRFRTLTAFSTSKNPTMDSMEAGLFSALELEIGIICACLPSFQVLFKAMFNILLGRPSGSVRASKSYQLRDENSDGRRSSKIGMAKNSLGGIRLTTTIRQEAPTPTVSETDLSLYGKPQSLGVRVDTNTTKASVKSEAWA